MWYIDVPIISSSISIQDYKTFITMYKYIKIRIIFRYCLPIMCSIYINYISGNLNDRTSYIVNILFIYNCVILLFNQSFNKTFKTDQLIKMNVYNIIILQFKIVNYFLLFFLIFIGIIFIKENSIVILKNMVKIN